MAARLGEDGNRQTLAHFITTGPRDPSHIRARLAWRMEGAIRPTALIFDDTGVSACVSPQYTGTAGKVTNCQVGVSLHCVGPCFGSGGLAAVPAPDLGPHLAESRPGQGRPPGALRIVAVELGMPPKPHA
jgi:hypothetical protein